MPNLAVSGRTCCGTPVATTSPIGAPILEPCKTTLGTATPSTRRTTPGWPAVGLKGFGGSCGPKHAFPRKFDPPMRPTTGGVVWHRPPLHPHNYKIFSDIGQCKCIVNYE